LVFLRVSSPDSPSSLMPDYTPCMSSLILKNVLL
jgi:hypothetical protein